MYQVNGYEGRKKVFAARMAQIPRVGDSLCIRERDSYVVSEVVWHIDDEENARADQRISIDLRRDERD